MQILVDPGKAADDKLPVILAGQKSTEVSPVTHENRIPS